MVTILREADQRPVPEIAKKHAVSAQTIYGWWKHFGTLDPADIKRLRHLEAFARFSADARTALPESHCRVQSVSRR